MAGYGRTRALAVAQESLGRKDGEWRFRVTATFGRTTTGRFGTPHTLTVAPTAYLPSLSAAGGRAIAGWIEHTAHGRRALRIATRSPGHGFSRPATLSGRGQVDTQTVATNGRDLAALFVRNGRVLARVRRAGHRWGSILELARARGGTQWQLQLGVDGDGRVMAVWRRHQLGVWGPEPALPRVGRDAPWALHLGPRADDRGRPRDQPGPPARGRTFALAWAQVGDTSGASPAQPRLTLAARGATTFSGPIAAAPPAGGLRGVRVARGSGGWLVVWVQPVTGGDGDGLARAAYWPDGAPAFDAPEDVSPSENVNDVDVVADAAGFVALWSARPEGTGPDVKIADLRTVARTARRLAG